MTIERVVGVGEALVRLTSTSRARLEQAQELRVTVGGAELSLGDVAEHPNRRRAATRAQESGVSVCVPEATDASDLDSTIRDARLLARLDRCSSVESSNPPP